MSDFDKILDSFSFGQTELIDVSVFFDGRACVSAKMELQNPTGSAKDRAAFYIISSAIKSGNLNLDSTIVEATSGNTGISLAAISREFGIACKIFMPENMSEERKELMRSYNATIVSTPAKFGMEGAMQAANNYITQHEGAMLADQFVNPTNVKAHIETTGPEIWEQTSGNIDILVTGIGTGGTIAGCSKYLKKKNPKLKVVGVGPDCYDLFLNNKNQKYHGLQGLANFQSPITKWALSENLIDEYIKCSDNAAIKFMKNFYCGTGIKVGISSGAVLYAVSQIVKNNHKKNIVAIMHDSGERYNSMSIF